MRLLRHESMSRDVNAEVKDALESLNKTILENSFTENSLDYNVMRIGDLDFIARRTNNNNKNDTQESYRVICIKNALVIEDGWSNSIQCFNFMGSHTAVLDELGYDGICLLDFDMASLSETLLNRVKNKGDGMHILPNDKGYNDVVIKQDNYAVIAATYNSGKKGALNNFCVSITIAIDNEIYGFGDDLFELPLENVYIKQFFSHIKNPHVRKLMHVIRLLYKKPNLLTDKNKADIRLLLGESTDKTIGCIFESNGLKGYMKRSISYNLDYWDLVGSFSIEGKATDFEKFLFANVMQQKVFHSTSIEDYIDDSNFFKVELKNGIVFVRKNTMNVDNNKMFFYKTKYGYVVLTDRNTSFEKKQFDIYKQLRNEYDKRKNVLCKLMGKPWEEIVKES